MSGLLSTGLEAGGVLASAAVLLLLPGILLVHPILPTCRRSALPLSLVFGFVCGYAGFTVLADWLTRLAGTNLLTLLAGPAVGTALIGLLLRRHFRGGGPVHSSQGLDLSLSQLGVCAVFACLVIAQVVPVALGEQVYWGEPYLDYTKHVAVTRAVARTGSPPLNPTFAPFADRHLFYYFGYYLFPGSLVRYVGFDPVTTILTCAALTAACFAAVCVSLGNCLTGGSRSGGWVALALCFVTGLDIIPVAFFGIRGVFHPNIEWWNPGQVTAITGFLVWVPQHSMASLYVLATHVLLGVLSMSDGPPVWRDGRVTPVVLLAAACGMTSTYVAELLFASLLVYALLSLARGGPGRRVAPLDLVALTGGALLIVPFYLHLLFIDRYQDPSQLPTFRPFAWEAYGIQLSFFRWFDRFHPVFGGPQAYRLVTLPLQYALEFGFWAIVGVWWVASGPRGAEPTPILSRLGVMCGCGLFIASVFLSVRKDPDLNWRVLHAAQGALVPVGAAFLLRQWQAQGDYQVLLRIAVLASLYLGTLGTLYDFYSLRFSTYEDSGLVPRIAGRACAAGPKIEAVTPSAARVQYNPTSHPPWQIYLNRQPAISDSGFNSICFGVSKAEHAVVLREVRSIFTLVLSPAEREQLVTFYNIDYLLVQKEDEIFHTKPEALFPSPPNVVCSSAEWVLLDTSALRR